VKDPVFDYLGTIYLDALDSAQFASTSEYKNELIIKLSSLRSDIIRAMRTALSKQQSHPLSLLNPAFAASTVIGLLCALIGGAFFFSINFRYYWVDNKSDMQFWVALASLICGTLGGALTFASFELIRRPRTRYSSFANQLDRLRLERDRMMH